MAPKKAKKNLKPSETKKSEGVKFSVDFENIVEEQGIEKTVDITPHSHKKDERDDQTQENTDKIATGKSSIRTSGLPSKSSIKTSGLQSKSSIRTSGLQSKSSLRSSGLRDGTSQSRVTISSADTADMYADQDIVTLTVPETAQKIVHCLVGKDLFVDKTWCMVKKADILEDVAIEDANSPFVNLTPLILAYKPDELLIGYEPFSSVPNQFMLCITEDGRNDVLNRLETMKSTYIRRIEQSKEVEPRKWESLGSEEFVDQFQIKETRKLISLEWIGDITKRCFTEPTFEDCDPDDMKNGYTCLVPSEKEKFDLVYRKTQETGTQAVPQKSEASAQTEPEIPTNASTQYAPETEISASGTSPSASAVKSQDLNAFFDKYLDHLLECLNYNSVYDLYHDDYPALYVEGEETQVQQLGTYHQYQSFTDVAAIEGKLVVSSSWHPNYTGIVAIAYANEIPCLMKELEFDSDQTDYEDEKTDEGEDGGEEPDLGAGARDWLDDEKRERESKGENTELFDKAIKKLQDLEATKLIWDVKIEEYTEEVRKPKDDIDSEKSQSLYDYKEYVEPTPEPEPDPDVAEDTQLEETPAEVLEGQVEEETEIFGTLGLEESASVKTSKTSLREQLETDIREPSSEGDDASIFMEEISSIGGPGVKSRESFSLRKTLSKSQMGSQRSKSMTSSRIKTHHMKKHRRNVPIDHKSSMMDIQSIATHQTTSGSMSSEYVGKTILSKETQYQDEAFDEVTDEEEIKEKQDELPLLEVNNPVLIWSFLDDLTPKLRLDSPYEVRVVSFSKHNGNLIAGGTASGQIVVWDITGRIEQLEKPEVLTQNQQVFRKRMEDLMSWRRDTRSKRRVRISAISNQVDSHLEKIASLTWMSPTTVISDVMDIIKNPSPDPNLQLLTSSIFGDIKVWDLKSEPLKVDYKKQISQFKTKDRYGRPPSLDVGLSPYNKLYRRWKPDVTFMTMYKSLPVLLTGLFPHDVPIKYRRVVMKQQGAKEVLEDRTEYRAVCGEIDSIPHQFYIGNLFGEAGSIVWEPPETKPPDGEYFSHTCRFWDSYHDGPILRVTKHPFIPSVCLTVGGHVFAIWHSANAEEPLLTKRYFGVYVTDGFWSSLRPSLIRIARSDGVVEIWDLLIQNHAPATTIIVSGRVITNISPPLLPEIKGLLGIADYNSAFRLFFIPQQFRVWSESELTRLKNFVNREPERKRKMKEWSKWWRENNVNQDREEKKQAEEKMKLDEEVRLEKEKQEEARKKYNEEVYKWYMRRRGKPFLLIEEAEEKWRIKQEEHMYEMVMAKKKIDRSEMEILMRPIIKEEKNEAQKHAKAQERLKQADHIFRQTVELLFPKSKRNSTSISHQEDIVFSEECNKLMDHYFGEDFDKLADEQVEIIERSPWQFDFEWSELLEKYNMLRMLFNDRRRKRSKALRWLRKKLREELLKDGRKVHVRKSHMARYPRRKIKQRHENLEWLKETYGDDYNVYWDKHHPCRRFADRKFRIAVEDMDGQLLGELSEPDVDEEELLELETEGKVMSSLELITEMGIEHIAEETFATDLDATLITLEGRSSLGVKSIPSFVASYRFEEVSSEKRADATALVGESLLPKTAYLTVPADYESPQDDSDVSIEIEREEERSSIVDNQMQELDYIQQSIGAKIDTLQTKKVVSTHKREISEGVKIKLEESESEEDEEIDSERGSDPKGSKELEKGSMSEGEEHIEHQPELVDDQSANLDAPISEDNLADDIETK